MLHLLLLLLLLLILGIHHVPFTLAFPVVRLETGTRVNGDRRATTPRNTAPCRVNVPNHIYDTATGSCIINRNNPSLRKQTDRMSGLRGPTRLMGLFGLGGLEVAVVCVGIGVVLGPDKIASLIRATGETAGEFKTELQKVPEEFQKGYDEGQMEAKSRNAKPIVGSIDSTAVVTNITSRDNAGRPQEQEIDNDE